MDRQRELVLLAFEVQRWPSEQPTTEEEMRHYFQRYETYSAIVHERERRQFGHE